MCIRDRPSDLPTGGHQTSPVAAISSPHRRLTTTDRIGRYRPPAPLRLAGSAGKRGGVGLKKAEEVMEILEAYDLVGTLRGAAELAGCDHHTVAHYVDCLLYTSPSPRDRTRT